MFQLWKKLTSVLGLCECEESKEHTLWLHYVIQDSVTLSKGSRVGWQLNIVSTPQLEVCHGEGLGKQLFSEVVES